MNKILSFILLFSILIIGFVHNSMMPFAMQDGMGEMKMNSSIGCCNKNEKENSYACCIEQENQINISYISSNSTQEKVFFVKIAKSLDDIFAYNTFGFGNKNLTQIALPPNIATKIKNYSYSDFIGIIQLNI